MPYFHDQLLPTVAKPWVWEVELDFDCRYDYLMLENIDSGLVIGQYVSRDASDSVTARYIVELAHRAEISDISWENIKRLQAGLGPSDSTTESGCG